MNKINHDCLTEIVYYWISLTISFVLGHSKYIDVVLCCARYVVRLTCMPIKVADGLSRLCLCNCIEPCMEGTNALTYCTTLVDWVRLAVGKCFGFLVDQPQNLAHPLKQVQTCFTIKNTDFRNIYNSTTNLNCFCQHDSRIFECLLPYATGGWSLRSTSAS